MRMVLPDGQNLRREKVRGWNIGKTKRAKKLLVAGRSIVIPRKISLGPMFRRYTGVTNSTSLPFAPAATNVATTSGLTPNWSGYLAVFNAAPGHATP